MRVELVLMLGHSSIVYILMLTHIYFMYTSTRDVLNVGVAIDQYVYKVASLIGILFTVLGLMILVPFILMMYSLNVFHILLTVMFSGLFTLIIFQITIKIHKLVLENIEVVERNSKLLKQYKVYQEYKEAIQKYKSYHILLIGILGFAAIIVAGLFMDMTSTYHVLILMLLGIIANYGVSVYTRTILKKQLVDVQEIVQKHTTTTRKKRNENK